MYNVNVVIAVGVAVVAAVAAVVVLVFVVVAAEICCGCTVAVAVAAALAFVDVADVACVAAAVATVLDVVAVSYLTLTQFLTLTTGSASSAPFVLSVHLNLVRHNSLLTFTTLSSLTPYSPPSQTQSPPSVVSKKNVQPPCVLAERSGNPALKSESLLKSCWLSSFLYT